MNTAFNKYLDLHINMEMPIFIYLLFLLNIISHPRKVYCFRNFITKRFSQNQA